MPVNLINGKVHISAGKVVAPSAADPPCCCCNVSGVELQYWAGWADGHCCNAAVFDVYAWGAGGNEIKIGQIDLNNKAAGVTPGPDCPTIYRTIVISEAQAGAILLTAQNCCRLYVQLRCAQPANVNGGWGDGKCHPELSNLRVRRPNNAGVLTEIFRAEVGEGVVYFDVCERLGA